MTLLRTVVLLSLAAFRASAIIIRDDVSDDKYLANENTWSFVLPMDPSGKLKKGECAATLIADRYAVTAAHCFGKNFKKFGINIAGEKYTVEAVHKNPCFSVKKDGPDGADVALIKLNKNAPSSVARIPVYQWQDEVGKRMEMLGWGDTGKQGIKPSQVVTDRKLRFAENIVTKAPIGGNGKKREQGMLIYTFDKNGLPREGLAWAGDSGGPLFITKNGVRYIAGTNSAGDCCSYGDTDAYSRLSIKYEWIMKTMQDDKAANFNCKTLTDGPTENDNNDNDNDNNNNDNNNNDNNNNNNDNNDNEQPGCKDYGGKFKVKTVSGKKTCKDVKAYINQGSCKLRLKKKVNGTRKVKEVCPAACNNCPSSRRNLRAGGLRAHK